MTSPVVEISNGFDVAGNVVEVRPIDSGHINDTYLIVTSNGTRYILQRINHDVFRNPHGLMKNVSLVTRHLKQMADAAGHEDGGRRVLQLIPHQSGKTLYENAAGEFWRMFYYVEDSYTVGENPSPAEIYQAAYGFGQFIALLMDLPAEQLFETIPKFHHGPSRYRAFVQAVDDDLVNRAIRVGEEVEFVQRHEHILTKPQQLLDRGELRLRVTHNDTKINNVLLDNHTNQALCVIDLDTVMPGLALYDFGDLVRTTVAPAAEDERDLSRVRLEQERLIQATHGFLAGSQGLLVPDERASLLLGPSYMALIMATRFLTDYLQGDTYYKTHRLEQNLDRSRTQMALVRGLLQSQDALAAALESDFI